MKNLILSSLLLLMTLQLSAQGTGSVAGTVLDGSMGNEPLMGATVKVVGEQMGTTTDMDGHFSIEMPAGKVLLQVSMMGFKTQVVNVKGKSIVEVVLQEDNKVLDEVVVVGYGSMKKRDLTGAMSQIKSEDLMKGGATVSALRAMPSLMPTASRVASTIPPMPSTRRWPRTTCRRLIRRASSTGASAAPPTTSCSPSARNTWM